MSRNEWVKVIDRLPNNMEVVLCILDIGSDNEYLVCICRFENNCFTHIDGTASPCKIEDCEENEYSITHWMPLPEPPEKD
jgi:hypothetical protein